MPEFRELLLIAITMLWVLLIRLGLALDTGAMDLESIYVDATLKEARAEESKSQEGESVLSALELEQRQRILRHQPYRLLPTSTLMRGSSAVSGRSYVWPQGLKSLNDLRLRRIDCTSRAVILDFGQRILTVRHQSFLCCVIVLTQHAKVRLINHTSVQIYRKDRWERSLRDIPSDKVRYIDMNLTSSYDTIRMLVSLRSRWRSFFRRSLLPFCPLILSSRCAICTVTNVGVFTYSSHTGTSRYLTCAPESSLRSCHFILHFL